MERAADDRGWELARVVGRRYTDGKMFLNCRNRIGPTLDEDAGNYFATIHYHKHEFATAGGIRRALVAEPRKPVFLSGPDRAPGMLRTLLGNVASATNWCAISKRIDIQDCKQVRMSLCYPDFSGSAHWRRLDDTVKGHRPPQPPIGVPGLTYARLTP